MNKSITIVGTTYKAEKYLENHFNNILNLKNLKEVTALIIMNSPTYKERQIAKSYSDNYPNVFNLVLLEKLEPIAESINRALKLANTEFIGWLDADDIRISDSYLLQKEVLVKNPAVDCTYGNVILVKKQGEVIGKNISSIEFDMNEFSRGCFISPAPLFRRIIFSKIGYFDEQFKSGGDFEFQARAAAAGVLFKKTNATLLYYTKEENSNSASSTILQPIERTVIELRYGIFDKIDYRYFDRAMDYRIHEIKEGNNWIPISNVIPNYEKYIDERKYLLPIGKRNHFIKMIKKTIKLPFKMIFKPQKFYREYFEKTKF